MGNDALLNNPWDTWFKVSMSNPETALAVIERNTDPEIWRLCDTRTFTSKPGNFIDSVTRQEFRADVVCQMHTHCGEGIVVFLIEHQSSIDAKMDLRMFHYAANLIYSTYVSSGVVPLLLPIVIYHGAARLNKTHSSWTDLVRPEAFRKFIRAGVLEPVTYDDIGAYSDEQILAHGRPAMMEIVLNHGRGPLNSIMSQLAKVTGSGNYLREDLLEAVRFIGARYNTDMRTLLSHVNSLQSPEFKEAFMDIIAEFENEVMVKGINIGIAKGKAEGIAKGKAEGIAKGKAEAMRTAARNFLANGVSDDIVMKSTGLSEDELDALRHS